MLYLELIDLAKPAREHLTSAYRSIDGEMQTRWPYSKSSITRIWSLGRIRALKPCDLTWARAAKETKTWGEPKRL